MKIFKHHILLFVFLLSSVMTYADDIFSTTYGEKWVTIQGVGVTGRYAYVSSNAVKHGTLSDTSDPGDEYLWCLVQSGTNVYIYNKSLGNTCQPIVSSSTTSSITMSSSNSNTFTIATSSYTDSNTSYSGYYIKPTSYSQYWSLYGGSSWSTDYPSAVVGYWNSMDHNCLWNIEVYNTSSDEDIISKTYSRTGVTAGSWQSFCLPMNIDIDELKNHFDEIYIPYNGEDLIVYSDLDNVQEGGADDIIGAKRKVVIRRSATASDNSSNSDTRYSFAYSADGSKYYHFYIADFTDEEEMGISQCIPFFAHVKADDTTSTDNTLTLNGYLFSDDETYDDSSVTSSFSVYKDPSLSEVDEDKTFQSIGILSSNGISQSYDGTLYTIDATTGDFVTTTSDALEVNHAYLLTSASATIEIHPIPLQELSSQKAIDYDINADGLINIVDQAHLINILNGATDTNGNADTNHDGTINVDDATILSKKILNPSHTE